MNAGKMNQAPVATAPTLLQKAQILHTPGESLTGARLGTCSGPMKRAKEKDGQQPAGKNEGAKGSTQKVKEGPGPGS